MFHVKFFKNRKHETGKYLVRLTSFREVVPENKESANFQFNDFGYYCDKAYLSHHLLSVLVHFKPELGARLIKKITKTVLNKPLKEI